MKMKWTHRICAVALSVCLVLGGLTISVDAAVVGQYSKVAAGPNHSFAIKSDGSLWGWGGNSFGQLGDGTTAMKLFATQVTVISNVVSVSTDSNHTLAVDSSGDLWGWGSNSYGQLGTAFSTSGTPTPTVLMSGVTQAAAGLAYSLAVKTDGSLWAWGSNGSGRLGDGTTSNSATPVHVMDGVAEVYTASDHSFAIKDDGTLWSWGSNYRGKVGDGSTVDRTVPIKILDNVVSVSGGYDFSLAVTADGSLYAWGQTYQWLNNSTQNYLTPTKIIDGVSEVISGFNFVMIVKTDGSLWACGDNTNGTLGNGSTTNSWAFVKVLDEAAYVACGSSHTLVVKTDGSLWGWGDDSYGQMGDGTGTNYALPMQSIANISGITKITTGSTHVMALKSDESLWMWGDNTQGQQGDGTNVDKYEPHEVMTGVKDIAGGSSHTLALKTDGSVWAWGYNAYGQVGNGSTINCRVPVQVLDDVAKIACGDNHSLAIRNDGTLWAWGDNGSGQLGNGTNTRSNVPIKVMDGVSEIAAGYLHTVALKTDGTIWTWGYNYSGQLGNGTNTNSPMPIAVTISSSSPVKQIAATANRTLVVLNDGSLWLWGDNSAGQAGVGTQSQYTTPVEFPYKVNYVAPGGLRTLAIYTDGNLYAWGSGPVGDGRENDARRTPVKIMDGVSAVVAATYNTYVLSGGVLWSWGGNHRGSLGYDPTVPRELMPAGSIAYVPPVVSVISHPSNAGVTYGAISGSLSVNAAADVQSARLIYQWYSNTTDSNFGGTSLGSAAQSASFVIPATLGAGTYYYFCEVGATGGAVPVRSNVAVVTVGKATRPPLSLSANVKAGQPTTGKTVVLPELAAGESYPASGTVGGATAALIDSHSISGGVLTLDSSSQADGTTATITVTVNGGANYNDYAVTVTVNAQTILKEDTPNAIINFTNESLTGLVPNAAYAINGEARSADINGRIAIDEIWLDSTITIIKPGDTVGGTDDSDQQNLVIPARPSAPSVDKVDTTGGGSNGEIIGVDSTMEYRLSTASAWTGISGASVTGLASGTYYVRVMATESAFAGIPASLTIAGSSGAVVGGGGGGGGGGGVPSGEASDTIPANGGEVSVGITQSNGEVTLDMPPGKVDEVIDNAKDGVAIFNLTGIPDATAAIMPTAALSQLSDAGLDLEFIFPSGNMTIDAAAAASMATQAAGTSVTVSMNRMGVSDLQVAQRNAVRGSDIVFSISVSSGAQQITGFDGTITVTVQYNGPLPVAVWYMDANGNLEKLDSYYDAATRTVTFSTNHLSLYVVGPDTIPFADVADSDWFAADVAYVYANGLMTGTSTDPLLFSPRATVTRGMIVTILYRHAGEPGTNQTSSVPFTDVAIGSYYHDAVLWAADNGIVVGYGGGLFGPDDPVTRQDLAVILMRYLNYLDIVLPVTAQWIFFADEANISDYAMDAIQTFSKLGIINGTGTNAVGQTIISPKGNATRAQAAAMLHRFCQLVSLG